MIFLYFSLIFVFASLYFYWRQNNKAKLGGKISLAKAIWLFYTIYVWFFLLPYIYFYHPISPYTTIWVLFSLWMWIRGVIELFMMFVTKNWTPPLGISHDITCALLFIGTSIYWYKELADNFSWAPFIFHLSLFLSVLLETYYAYGFYKIVGEKTKGDDAVWYAGEDNKDFKFLVKLTGICNYPLFISLFFFIYWRFDLFQ